MNRSLALIIVLLIASNAWSAYLLVNADDQRREQALELSLKTQNDSLRMCVAIANQALAGNTHRKELLAAAKSAAGFYPVFTNDGHEWVGAVGMRYDENERLVALAEWVSVDD